VDTSRDDRRRIDAAMAGTFPVGGELTVHRLGLGAMRLTGNPAEGRRVLRRAVELGVNLIDTADFYGEAGLSERLIAEALHPYPDGLVIATKGLLRWPGAGRGVEAGSLDRLRRSVEGSLRRLRVDRVDLYQLARVDPGVAAEDQFGVLAELREQGKIRHVGLSEVGVDEVAAARAIVPVVTVQNRYNLADRGWEGVLDYCRREGLGFLPWFPLGAGRLADAGGALVETARRHAATPAQVALAWLLRRSPVMVPIPGTSSVAHLEENVAAAALQLDDDELEVLGPMR
jgi:pyridoxine 4-dehydrogenase